MTLLRQRAAFVAWDQAGLVASLVSLCVLFALLSPYFLTLDNGLNIARASAYTGITAAIVTLLLIGGGIDLSLGSVMAFVSVLAARMFAEGFEVSAVLAASLFSGLAVGLANGACIAYAGINPLIMTMGTQFAVRGLAYYVADGRDLLISEPSFLKIGRADVIGLPVSVFVLAASLLVAHLLLHRTVFGRHVFALGGNAGALRMSGVNVGWLRVRLYVLSGLAASLGGIVMAASTGTGVAYSATGVELTILAAIVLGGTALLGGRGSVLGTLLGIAIFGVIANGIVLAGIAYYWQMAITGVILVAAVAIDGLRRRGEL